MMTSRPTPRLGVSLLLSIGLALGLAGCSGSDPVPGAPAAQDDEVQFTSDSGLITINVPDDWQLATAAARDAMGGFGSTAGGPSNWLSTSTAGNS